MSGAPQKQSSFKGRALGKFRDARQAALEKMGKTENTVEPEFLKQQTAVLEQHNHTLSTTSKQIAKQSKQYSTLADDGMKVADALADHAETFGGDTVSKEYKNLCDRLAEFHVGMEDLRLDLHTKTADIADSLRALTKAEIRHAKQTKGKYDKVRLTYEAQTTKVNKLRAKSQNLKADEAQKECDNMRDHFESAGNDTLDTIETANMVCEYETVDQLASYLESYQLYFAKCNAWLQQAKPLIQESRDFAQRQRMEKLQRERTVLHQATKGRVFGASLTSLAEKENSDVPQVVSEMIQYLMDNALGEEGLFRVTGFKSEVASLRAKAEADDFHLTGLPNLAHEVASLLKTFLRELPEPLFPYDLYDKFVALADIPAGNRLQPCRALLTQLNSPHRATLQVVLKLLRAVAARADDNKMTPANLSIVMSPNLLVSKDVSDPLRLVKESTSCSALFEWMINTSDTSLFGTTPTPPSKQGLDDVVL